MAKKPPHPNADDLQLVEDILDQDPTAWNEFVERYSDRVWRRSWQICNETCIHKHSRGSVFCVFHALAADGVQPAGDMRPGCDEGLEVYAFIFDYLYNREQHTGKLKAYDGRAPLDAFTSVAMGSNMRTDWIRHHRRLRIDQITYPPEIERLDRSDQQVYEQMLMQRPTETIAREVGFSIEDADRAQERVTHALMANGNLHLILRNPEGSLEAVTHTAHEDTQRVLPMRRVVDEVWAATLALIAALPESEKILLDMAFDEELDARTILERVEALGLALPVTPRSGTMTIHTIYQSIDAILKDLSDRLATEHPALLDEAHHWLGSQDADRHPSISHKGLKMLLKTMGLTPPSDDASAGRRASEST